MQPGKTNTLLAVMNINLAGVLTVHGKREVKLYFPVSERIVQFFVELELLVQRLENLPLLISDLIELHFQLMFLDCKFCSFLNALFEVFHRLFLP